MSAIWAWIVANPAADVAIVVWVVANVAPRPHPDQVENSKWKAVWTLIDRLCVLTAGDLPGKFKWLFVSSPASANAAPAQTKDGAP